jgi:Protein of unknown function (DUF2442)
MHHPIYRVVSFTVVAPYTLRVAFDDGTEQSIDFKPVLRGALFGPLQDLQTFNGVTLDPEAGTLVWPNGADFDPATLHDWPQVRDEFIARAALWASHENRKAG